MKFIRCHLCQGKIRQLVLHQCPARPGASVLWDADYVKVTHDPVYGITSVWLKEEDVEEDQQENTVDRKQDTETYNKNERPLD